MGKLALLFSGQGSQYVGMGLDYPSQLFEQASYILGYDVKTVLNDEIKLNQTLYTQPLIILKSLLGFEAIKDHLVFDGVCGFSLGEYSAFYAAGIFDFNQLLTIVSKRALLMQEATISHPGSMAAIIGLSEKTVKIECQSISEKLVIANYNTPTQYVISGPKQDILKAIDIFKTQARRVIELNVSGAFHSPLMTPACQPYEQFLQTVKTHRPHVSVFMNQTGEKLEYEQLKARMVSQINHSVQWIKSIESMKKEGFTHFLEIGPGKTLMSFVKKIDPTLEVMHFDHYEQIDEVKRWLNKHGFQK